MENHSTQSFEKCDYIMYWILAFLVLGKVLARCYPTRWDCYSKYSSISRKEKYEKQLKIKFQDIYQWQST